MADPHLFEIENGYFGLKLVDTAAVGYLDTWQSPSGDIGAGVTLTPLLATLAAYTTPASGWSATGWTCQITKGQLTPKPSTTTITRKATFCVPGATIPTPDETSFSFDIGFYQDVDLRNSLSLWLFQNDTLEAYVYMGMAGDGQALVGVVRVQAAAIGGDPRKPLEATCSLPFTRRPLIERPAT